MQGASQLGARPRCPAALVHSSSRRRLLARAVAESDVCLSKAVIPCETVSVTKARRIQVGAPAAL